MALKTGLKINQADLKAFNRKMDKLAEFSEVEVKKSLEHAGKNGEGRMKKDAPVDTGRLKRNITGDVKGKDLIFEATAIDPETGVDYASAQEFGGRHFAATPYFFANFRKVIAELHKDLSRKLKLISEN